MDFPQPYHRATRTPSRIACPWVYEIHHVGIFAVVEFFAVIFGVLSLPGVTWAASIYKTTHTCNPSNFFDCFNFFTAADPTNGFVQYVDRNYAETHDLIRTNQRSIYMGTEYTTKFPPTGPGRPSVRLESNFAQTHGLYILDLTHMPFGCGTWPAFWTLGPDWPNGGEIDIIEGANTASQNLASLHTSDNCTIAGQGGTGTLITNDCSIGTSNTGCGVQDSRTNSYGEGFNRAGGGVYAMEWTSSAIRVWFFPRDKIPQSISGGTPNPGQDFGRPMANFFGSCDIDKHMRQHRIIFDLTFCGDYAGAVYGSSSCPKTSGLSSKESCNTFVANNPAAFKNAYWEIQSLKVYQLQNVPGSSSSRSTSSKTSTRLSSIKPVASLSSMSTHSLAMGVSTTSKNTGKSTSRPTSRPTLAFSTRRRPSIRLPPTTPLPTAVEPSVGSRTFSIPSPTGIPECGKNFKIAEPPIIDRPAEGQKPIRHYDYAIHCNRTLQGRSLGTPQQVSPNTNVAIADDGQVQVKQLELFTFALCIAHCDAYGAECSGLVFTNGTEPSTRPACILYSLQDPDARPRSGKTPPVNQKSDEHESKPATEENAAEEHSNPDETTHHSPERNRNRLHRRHNHVLGRFQKREALSPEGEPDLEPRDGSYVALRVQANDKAPAPALKVPAVGTTTTRVDVWVTVTASTCTDTPLPTAVSAAG